jgi:hypothetical protein
MLTFKHKSRNFTADRSSLFVGVNVEGASGPQGLGRKSEVLPESDKASV